MPSDYKNQKILNILQLYFKKFPVFLEKEF